MDANFLMKALTRIKDAGVEFGADVAIPANGNSWPLYVFHYKLTVDETTLPPNGHDLKFKFDDASGWAPWLGEADYRTQIETVRKGGKLVGWKSFTGANTAPDIRLVAPCFVIYQLDPRWNWHLLPGDAAIRSKDDRSAQYRRLRYYADGAPDELMCPKGTAGTPPAQGDVCRLLTFAATMVQPGTLGGADKCNLYIEFNWSTTSSVPFIVDPDIKNNGGDNP